LPWWLTARRRGELRLVIEDRRFEFSQFSAGLEPEFVLQRLA
jgi:hypothetical protein